jgi:Got1/Sft2-like family
VFCALLFLSALFFALAFFVGLPMIAFKPQKFALSFTCGSITFMGSFGILKGPMDHLQSMFTADRMFFTTIYFGSMFMTLYLTFTKGGIKGYALVMAASAAQLLALLWYLVSFLPGGAMGLQLVARAMVTMLQPIIGACCRFQAMCISKCVSYFVRG